MKVHKYEFRDEDILIDGAVPEAKVYVLEADALAYARSEREAGAKQERERIYNEVGAMATELSGPAITFSRILDAIRGASAKVCTCYPIGSRHHKSCPCYEPPKKVCTCGTGSQIFSAPVHNKGCPLYVAPARPAPLEEMPIPATGVEHLALQWQIAAKLNEAIRALNALIAKEVEK